jgi:triosephosphate isomerase
MRKPIVAGNWKMNKTVKEALTLVKDLLPELDAVHSVERVVCPPFPALFAVSTLISGTEIGLGAQNLHWEASGAYTGEVSAGMIKELCEYVIIGHSERRQYFGETDQTVNKKAKAALAAGLTPIVCVGETLEQRQAGQTAGVIIRQTRDGLQGLTVEEAGRIVIAYEPVWAIGTGLASSGNDANEVVKDMIRPTLASLFGEGVAQAVRVQYGGSVTSKNADEFFTQPDIDGALVGGASLKAEEFIQIVRAAVK